MFSKIRMCTKYVSTQWAVTIQRLIPRSSLCQTDLGDVFYVVLNVNIVWRKRCVIFRQERSCHVEQSNFKREIQSSAGSYCCLTLLSFSSSFSSSALLFTFPVPPSSPIFLPSSPLSPPHSPFIPPSTASSFSLACSGKLLMIPGCFLK